MIITSKPFSCGRWALFLSMDYGWVKCQFNAFGQIFLDKTTSCTPEESWDRLQQIPVTQSRTKRVWIMNGGMDGWMDRLDTSGEIWNPTLTFFFLSIICTLCLLENLSICVFSEHSEPIKTSTVLVEKVSEPWELIAGRFQQLWIRPARLPGGIYDHSSLQSCLRSDLWNVWSERLLRGHSAASPWS